MSDDERLCRVRDLLAEYVRSPSLRHIRDGYGLQRLASDILKAVERANPIWTKWSAPREWLARAAAYCWIPPDDLRDHLNGMDGPMLTTTDVVQRLRAFNEEPFEPWPDDELRETCLEIYLRERTIGTDMPAIIGAVQQFVEEETERRRLAHQAALRERIEAERLAGEARLRSGADCKWTALGSSKTLHCRVNGRTFRLEPQPDKRLKLLRVDGLDAEDGELVGRYQRRTDATRVVNEVAYKPESRWR
jgi:hypothetical protein